MSKICIKCGNVIPDGMDVCPTCGREEYDESNLQNVLNELGLSLDSDHTDPDSDPVAADSAEDEPTIRLPELADDAAENTEDADEASEVLSEEPASEAGDSIKAILGDAIHTINPPKQEKKAKKQNAGKRPDTQGKKKTASGEKKQKESAKHPQEEKPQKNSATVIGVVIGLIIALLVIGCGVMFMLFRMGFFTSMSDDDLLNNPATTVGEGGPTMVPELPEPSQAPIMSSDLEDTASSLESSAQEAEVAAPSTDAEEQIECTKFTITGTEYLILYSRGVTTEISYVIEPAELRDKITWESSDETIATVDAFGTIRARRGGTCSITGTCGDKSIKAYVTNEFTVPTTTLDMNMEDITLTYEGQTAELAIDYELSDEQIKSTVWESSDPDVAMVDDDGVVTAISNGTAVITASIADYTASCIVRCVNVTGNRGYNNRESEYVINYEDVTLTRKGEYFQLTLKSILGTDVPDYTWESDDPDVATVDSKGIVTAVSDGTANINTKIGQDKFRCIVRVRIAS